MFNVLLVVLSYFSSFPSLNIIADQRSSGGSLLNPTYSASLISAYIKAIVTLCKSPNGMRPASLVCFVAQTQSQNEYRLGLRLNFSLHLLYPSRSSTPRSSQTLVCLSDLTMDLASASTPHDASVFACVPFKCKVAASKPSLVCTTLLP
jgi:hypothetical protein